MIRSSEQLMILLAATLIASPRVDAATATVAVAANFVVPLEAMQKEFEADTGHKLIVTGGSTGQLYAQITNGAPFDVFLAADQARPAQLAETGVGDGSTRFTYAVGQLALWAKDTVEYAQLELDVLRSDRFRWLAIANPELAPYGAAARDALRGLGLWDALQNRIVQGQSIAQTFAMAETRNADLGLVALSQAVAYKYPAVYVVVPESLHDPINQDAILLNRAHGNRAAMDFLAFLKTPAAAKVIEAYGYATAVGD